MGKAQSYPRGILAMISGDKGQRFFNFAYSIGAAIVIWGALFKILHLPGGNALLSIGMGTEVLMFVLTAFDRPAKTYNWENVFPALTDPDAEPVDMSQAMNGGGQGGVMVEGGGTVVLSATSAESVAHTPAVTDVQSPVAAQMDSLATDLEALHNTTRTLNEASETLSRNINSLNTLYELQLRAVTAQLHSLDNASQGISTITDSYTRTANQALACSVETEKMARNIAALNAIYARMLSAMEPQQPAQPSNNGIA